MDTTPGPNFTSYFSFDPTTDTLVNTPGEVFVAMASGQSHGFDFYESSPTQYYVYANSGSDVDARLVVLGSLTFTTAGSSSAVPEPPAAALFGLALLGLALMRRKPWFRMEQ